MKKKLSALICGAIMTLSSMAFASVPSDQVILGDLQPGIHVDKVKEIYGEPLRVVGDKWLYRGFYIELSDEQRNIVEEVATEDSGFATQYGIIVGMSENELTKAYGTADDIDFDDDSNEREYTYYSSDGKYKMNFDVRNGVIVKIKCELR